MKDDRYTEADLPWPRRESPAGPGYSHFVDEGPDASPFKFTLGDHYLELVIVGEASMTPRSLWRVRCLSCRTEIHPGTTGPRVRSLDHANGRDPGSPLPASSIPREELLRIGNEGPYLEVREESRPPKRCTHPPEVSCHRCVGLGELGDAVTDTIVDMIKSRTYCGCCDSDTTHARLLVSMLKRFPVETWPTEAQLDAEGVKGFFEHDQRAVLEANGTGRSNVYDVAATAIRTRTPPA